MSAPLHTPRFPDLRRKEIELLFGRQLINKQQNKNTSIKIPFSNRSIPIIPPTTPPTLPELNRFSSSSTIQKREKEKNHHSSRGRREDPRKNAGQKKKANQRFRLVFYIILAPPNLPLSLSPRNKPNRGGGRTTKFAPSSLSCPRAREEEKTNPPTFSLHFPGYFFRR